MRRLFASILFCGIIAIIGCSNDDATSPPPPAEPLAESTIGNTGGTLADDDFSLVVPPGAFATDTELSLYEAPGDELPDESVTGIYRLTGLPDEIDSPLTLTMRCAAPPDGDPFITVGEEVDPGGGGAPFIHYVYLDATYDDGFLTCQWHPPTYDSETAKSTTGWFYFFGPQHTLTRHVPNGDDPHFIIRYPYEGSDQIDVLGGILEQAYQTYANFGFDFSFPHLPDFYKIFPVVVNFSPVAPPVDQYVQYFRVNFGDRFPSSEMTLYRDHLSATEMGRLGMASSAGIGRIILEGQILRGEGGTPDTQHCDWLSEAFGLWAESLFTANSNHVPTGFDASYLDLNFGLVNGFMSGLIDPAIPALLDYLIDQEDNGLALMLRTSNALRAGTPASEAFLNAITGDSSNWWPGFLESIIAGDIYNIHSSVFLEESDHFDMAEVDWAETSTRLYNDLSAQLYRLSPSHESWEDGAYLDLDVLSDDVGPSYAEALVFTLDGTDLTLVARGTDLRIEGLADLHEDGIGLLVVVFNAAWDLDSWEEAEITLDMQVGQTAVVNSHMYISLGIMMEYSGEGPGHALDTSGNETLDGIFDGNEFQGSFSYTAGGWNWSCSAICHLDIEADPPRLLDWAFNKEISNPSTGYVLQIVANGGEVTHDVSGTGLEQFAIFGESACGAIYEVGYTVTRGGEVTGRLVNHYCESTSLLRVDYYDWVPVAK